MLLAHTLIQAGVAPGDRVLILMPTDIEYAIAVHAVLMAGAVIVPLPPTIKPSKLNFIAEDTSAAALVTDARLSKAWLPVRGAGQPWLQTCIAMRSETLTTPGITPWPNDAIESAPCAALAIDQDLAALIYTSGTTGQPKGVMLSHLNMVHAWRSVQSYLQLRADDVLALAIPPTFSYGLYNLLMGLGVGATVVLEPQAAFPAQVVETLRREQATVLPGVPTLFASLLELEHFSAAQLPSLRLVTNAAAALAPTHLSQLRRRLPDARLLSMYGMTECMRISYLPPEQLDHRPGSVGRGMPNQAHWLVDEAGEKLPHGSTGELVVRGSHVMRGYWRRADATAERLKPGAQPGEIVLHTGDMFRSDTDGYLYFAARKDDIIKSRGEKVAPREVEEAILQLSEVAACAVVGVPDDLLGQAVKAFVTPRTGATLDAKAIIRHCQQTLDPHLVPKFVEFLAEMPRTESGKIRHASLRGASAPAPLAPPPSHKALPP